MPPAVIAAGIGAAGSLGGALIGSGAQKSALKSQERGNTQALQYQRERDAAADKRYERDYTDWQGRQAAQYKTRQMIAAHYGIQLPDMPAPAAPAAGPARGSVPGITPGPNGRPGWAGMANLPPGVGPGQPGVVPAPASGGPAAAPVALQEPAQAPPGSEAGPAPEASNWNDWSRYARLQ